MIGLGSNRLTVCRRGGMSVTQAGRGGMEWLAGGRMPSWANPYLPYSKAAGEALVAQFPTQWPTIRDYGFAHPEIVPYVEANPIPLGNYIVYYQNCENIEVASSGAYLEFGTFNKYEQYDLELDCFYASGYLMTTNFYMWLNKASNSSISMRGGQSLTCDLTKRINLIFSYDGSSQTNCALSLTDGINTISTSSSMGADNIKTFGIFCLIQGVGIAPQFWGTGKVWAATLRHNGVEENRLVPCYHKMNGTIGVFDLVAGEFLTNKGSGSFIKGPDVN